MSTTKEEAKAKAEEVKATREREEQQRMKEAAGIADNMVRTYSENELETRKFGQLRSWAGNPRSPGEEIRGDLAASLFGPDGSLTYDVRYPMVVMATDDPNIWDVIQGNRRLSVMQTRSLDPEVEIPVIVHTGSIADALLVACNDVGAGTLEKGIGDLENVIGQLMRDHALTAHTVSAYLWRGNRAMLYAISPAAKKAGDLQGAQAASRGRLQTLQAIARLPETIRVQIYAEHSAGTRKGRVFDGETVKALSKVKAGPDDLKQMQEIVDKRKSDLVANKDKIANTLTAKIFADKKFTFRTPLLRELADLFSKPDKDASDEDKKRDAIALLTALDARYAD